MFKKSLNVILTNLSINFDHSEKKYALTSYVHIRSEARETEKNGLTDRIYVRGG